MKGRKIWEIGGFIAGAVLIAFGAVAIGLGATGFDTTRDAIKQEQIYFGSADDPAVAKYANQWADKQVTTGDQARAFAQIMRYHTVNAEWNPEHLTYAQMGRFLAAGDPSNPKGTSDEEAALKDEKGNPVSNSFRNTWVTETALSTALNVSFMAERLSILAVVIGVALLLSGIGFLLLALAVFGRAPEREAVKKLATRVPAAG